MKVLFDHPFPFLLAHGGFQIQIEQTKAGLEANGLEVEYLRWWDEGQTGDVIHYFGRPWSWYLEAARSKGMKIVLAELLTGQGSRQRWKLAIQRQCIRLLRRFRSGRYTIRLAWNSFSQADACVALTPWEAHLMTHLFGADSKKVHVLPNGVEEVFLDSTAVPRGPWLVCTATITERKRVLELARAAVQAQTPLWIIGRPYHESAPYFERLLALVRQHSRLIRYEGGISDRAKLARAYREARGFVLLSAMESLSLSALEAAACECPLLLSDLPWARTVFGEQVTYCPISAPGATAACLRDFYQRAPGLGAPPRPLTWKEVGGRLARIYEGLNTSR